MGYEGIGVGYRYKDVLDSSLYRLVSWSYYGIILFPLEMSHKSVVALIQDTVSKLGDGIEFGHGRTSDFNIQGNKAKTIVWLDPLNAQPTYTVNGVSNFQKTWNINIIFYQKDTTDSLPKQYNHILDTTDTLVDKFVNLINLLDDDLYDFLVLSGINQQSFVKVTAHILTGWILTFNLTVPDSFDYCIEHDC